MVALSMPWVHSLAKSGSIKHQRFAQECLVIDSENGGNVDGGTFRH